MRILAAMSGGVDSSVAAERLLKEGHEVIGLFMRSGTEAPAGGDPRKQGCCSIADSEDAWRCADILRIPFYVLDFQEDFSRIVDDFVEAYAEGRTPNPCVRCNNWLKFGHLLDFARQVGAEVVATGHYASIVECPGERLALARPRDRAKDQTYFLAGLTQEQLRRARFPLADLEKSAVRELARTAGLPTAEKPESQEICFVPSGDYRPLVRERRPETMAPGAIRDRDGNQLGRHEGIAGFTVGQRRGLGIAAERPLYVLELDPASRTVVVGGREELAGTGCEATEVNWMGIAPIAGDQTLRVCAQIRSRHRAAPARVVPLEGGSIRILFDSPQEAITPGQTIVLYDSEDQVVLAGATIAKSVG